MKYVVYFAIGWCVMLAGAGEAMAYDGNKLLDYCHDYTEVSDFGAGLCIGYLAGVQDTARGWQQEAKIQLYCIPEAAKSDQLIRVTVKFLENVPAQLHYSAATLVEAAFVEAFPCKEGN